MLHFSYWYDRRAKRRRENDTPPRAGKTKVGCVSCGQKAGCCTDGTAKKKKKKDKFLLTAEHVTTLAMKLDDVDANGCVANVGGVANPPSSWCVRTRRIGGLTAWNILQKMTLITSECGAARSLSIKWP